MIISLEFFIAFLMLVGSFLIGHRFGEHSGIRKTIDKFVLARLVEIDPEDAFYDDE